jgi:GNAT superfamily N-acetyltransferase
MDCRIKSGNDAYFYAGVGAPSTDTCSMPSAPTLLIRPLSRDERAVWEPLWQGYLDFYEAAVSPDNNDVLWARIHDPAEPIFALGAYRGGTLIGIAHYIFHRSCWTIDDYCYLQDLFVAKDVRGSGTGRALIAAVEQAAREKGASRIHWLTKEDNHSARALYDQVAQRSGFIQYRKLF